MNYIGEYIRKYRGKTSLREFAEKCGISHTHLDSIEKGYDPRTGKPVKVTVDTLKKIANAMGMSINDLLIQSGDVKLDELHFDNAEFVNLPTDTIQIPVLGTIKAGIAIEAQQDIIEYIDIPKDWIKGGKTFYGLKISGDSMYPKYSENDIVIFEHTEDYTIANNKDCAIMVNGFDATFKNVTINENGITLVPFNLNNSDGYQPTFYSKEQISSLPVKIVGIAREKRTRL